MKDSAAYATDGSNRGSFVRVAVATIGLAVAHAALFVGLAVAFGERVPIRLSVGEKSRWGGETFKEAFGGVTRLDLAVSAADVNDVLAMDRRSRDSWMRATAPRIEMDPDSGMPIIDPAAPPSRPESWPFEGRVDPGIFPAVFLAAPFGVESTRSVVGDGRVMKLDPLIVSIGPDRTLLLFLAFPPLLAGLWAARRMFAVARANSAAARWSISVAAGVLALFLIVGFAAILAARSVPQWNTEWREWIELMRARGEMSRPDPWTAANIRSVGSSLAVLLVVGVVAARPWRR